MRIFATKRFDKWARDEGISDQELCVAAKEAFAGQVEADLGGYLFKKRVARAGGGKSGGFRTIIGYRKKFSERVIFLHGYPKNKKDNINTKEHAALSVIAAKFVEANDEQVEDLVEAGDVREMECTK